MSNKHEFKIPNMATGAVIPPNIAKLIAEEEQNRKELKRQRIYQVINTVIAILSLIVAIISLLD